MIALSIPEINGDDNQISLVVAGFLPKIRTNNDILIIKFDKAQNDQCYSVGDSSFDKIGLGGVVALN
ncbi:hypothetical protein [Lactiplantibacillus plantarum]|jgi:hypothetical protein|uniref:Uncharacterized protein n=1 Tax=Lactiplantibacillus plantarum TaxID=1590 RepID=A0AAW3RAN7_LACPN|nr:hypothetical protein [Lactiplantibacillus plantarum]APP13293.1 hypothetical protein BSG92_13655 [Lactiplantibacillus plantarum subsp. plantarum]EFK29844.1 hypothetical protein HMPREF0531_11096 [Lactiplantibacillus plantarum subsp. plantarum ATCC 14917 = JCM 1149 = CGMCC 1.2437]ERO42807.1 hypothetical protein LPLWJ_01520 [Lactiplantibacillus plantarum WJL]TYA18287.1 hypothetical protein FXE14_10855 [Lactobacillus sp. LSI2-1]AQX92846.1 hypothetical protein LC611_03490 [Lactiplantibacillus pla